MKFVDSTFWLLRGGWRKLLWHFAVEIFSFCSHPGWNSFLVQIESSQIDSATNSIQRAGDFRPQQVQSYPSPFAFFSLFLAFLAFVCDGCCGTSPWVRRVVGFDYDWRSCGLIPEVVTTALGFKRTEAQRFTGPPDLISIIQKMWGKSESLGWLNCHFPSFEWFERLPKIL